MAQTTSTRELEAISHLLHLAQEQLFRLLLQEINRFKHFTD